jgi:ribonuclease VapC
MVIDTSALYAIVASEPERPAFIEAIVSDRVRLVSAVTLLEALIVVNARMQDRGVERLLRFIDDARIQVVPVDEDLTHAAHAGWLKFGKGRARAGLNLGDCCSYALARTRGMKLLFKGSDFSQTDVEPAIR